MARLFECRCARQERKKAERKKADQRIGSQNAEIDPEARLAKSVRVAFAAVGSLLLTYSLTSDF
jgi:hypothetical protein